MGTDLPLRDIAVSPGAVARFVKLIRGPCSEHPSREDGTLGRERMP